MIVEASYEVLGSLRDMAWGKGVLFWRILVESNWPFKGIVIAFSECLFFGRIQAISFSETQER